MKNRNRRHEAIGKLAILARAYGVTGTIVLALSGVCMLGALVLAKSSTR